MRRWVWSMLVVSAVAGWALAGARPTEAAAPEVRQAVGAVLAAVPCAKITTRYLPDDAVSLSGRVPRQADIRHLRQVVPTVDGVGDVTVNFQVVAWPFCQALEVLDAPLHNNFLFGKPMTLRSATGSNTFLEDTPLILEIKTPGFFAQVYVDYYQMDGTVVHILPNDQETDNKRAPDVRFTLGDVTAGQRQWLIFPPFGTEMLTVIASPAPLALGQREVAEDGKAYLADLKDAIQAALPSVRENLHADYMWITTEATSTDAASRVQGERQAAAARRRSEEELARLAEAAREKAARLRVEAEAARKAEATGKAEEIRAKEAARIAALRPPKGIAPGPSRPQAQVAIGAVRLIKAWAYGTPPQSTRRDLYVKDRVVADEFVETVVNGALHIRFADDTEFRLGATSSARLDRFVYNPNASAGELSASLSKGAFRFITGRIPAPGYRLRTPVATVGVRGTDFVVLVASDGTSIISVLAGLVDVTPTGAPTVTVAAGQAVVVSPDGTNSAPIIQPAVEIGLTEDAGQLVDDQQGGGGGD